MEKIDVNIDTQDEGRSYSIYIGSGVLKEIAALVDLQRYSKVAVVSDSNVGSQWLKPLQDSCPVPLHYIEISAGEDRKDIDGAQILWHEFLRCGLDRRSLVLNLGGGVVGDLGAFAASTFMRGVAFIQIPTTLLAQVDASVGGKAGINFASIKNIVGTFTQPAAVIIDIDTLQTLPRREMRAGFAEVIKHGFIYDPDYLQLVRSLPPESLAPADLVTIIKRSCEIKRTVIEIDEREGGLRKILNFGHTIGHALEAISLKGSDPLLHGEAVSIGMVAEAKISVLMGLFPEDGLTLLEHTLHYFELPTRMADLPERDAVLNLVNSDKKNVSGRVRWTLLQGIGKAQYDVEVEREIVDQAISYISNVR